MSPHALSPDFGFRWLERRESPEGDLLTLEVPGECPAFLGHFPGRPILPAVAQLALFEEGLGRLAGSPPRAISEISGLRFRRTVGPGERLTLAVGPPAASGSRRFEIRGETGTVSGGSIRTAGDEPEGERPDPPSPIDWTSSEELFASGRVPHAPPALLIESLIAQGPSGARARARIPGDSPFAVGGEVPGYLGLEIAAQAAALTEALGREGEGGGPRVGYLVAIRQARCFAPTLPVGETLDVILRFAGSAPPLSLYEIRVEREGRPEVAGTISTWIASQEEEGAR